MSAEPEAGRGKKSRRARVRLNVAQRIVSVVSGFVLLALNACTLTIQSGPSSPAAQAYAPAPQYVPVAAAPAPARTPATSFVVTRPGHGRSEPAAPCAPSGRPHAPVASAPPRTAGPLTPSARPRAPLESPSAPNGNAVTARNHAPRPVFTTVPIAHPQTPATVSATVQGQPPTGRAVAPYAVPSPRTLAPKPGDPRVRNWL